MGEILLSAIVCVCVCVCWGETEGKYPLQHIKLKGSSPSLCLLPVQTAAFPLPPSHPEPYTTDLSRSQCGSLPHKTLFCNFSFFFFKGVCVCDRASIKQLSHGDISDDSSSAGLCGVLSLRTICSDSFQLAMYCTALSEEKS